MISKLIAIATLWLALSSASATAAPIVNASPSSATVYSGAEQQFTAVVTGAEEIVSSAEGDRTVNWSASAGTIDASGMFTAPTVKFNEIVIVKATRVDHPRQFVTVQVRVIPVPAQHTVTLGWNPDPGAVSFSVYRGNSQDDSFALLASGITQTGYVDATVSAGETYYYATTATNAAGEESAYSSLVLVVIP
ncbi:MAG TPA: hypothetical protein VN950_14185 [Terriglobales bacterium]|nr:hypothetical protein [Terriglobales bacterium]